MDRRRLLILVGVVAATALVVALVYLLRNSKPGEPWIVGDPPNPGEDGPQQWLSAPDPAEDIEKLDEIRRLWPDIDRPRPDRAAVRREFQEFAARYPENIYIPAQFLPEQSQEQKDESRRTIDVVGSVESRLAAQRAQARGAAPGQEGAEAPLQPTLAPEEQQRYFSFKVRELESRIQLVEYAMEKGRLPEDQQQTAESDLARWKKELEEIRAVQAQIPR